MRWAARCSGGFKSLRCSDGDRCIRESGGNASLAVACGLRVGGLGVHLRWNPKGLRSSTGPQFWERSQDELVGQRRSKVEPAVSGRRRFHPPVVSRCLQTARLQLYQRLCDSIRHRGNIENAVPTGALRHRDRFDRRWEIASRRQTVPELVEVLFQAILRLLNAAAIHSTAPEILLDLLPGQIPDQQLRRYSSLLQQQMEEPSP